MASAGKPVRVLMLLENNPYPQDTRVHREATTLTEAGLQVIVIAPRGGNQPNRETLDGVHVYRYPTPPSGNGFIGFASEYGFSLIAMFWVSLIVLFREGFDIIHAHNPPDFLVMIGAFYKPFGKMFVFDHHDISPEMYNARFGKDAKPLIFNILMFFEKFTFRVADHVITTNESYRELALTRGGKTLEQVTIVRNGPDSSRIRVVDPDPELRAKAPIIIGYVGVMGFQDGIDYFIRAAYHLLYDLKRSDFYCVMIGKGDAWESLRALTKELRLEDHVWFTGRVSDEDLLRYLSSTHICVAPDPYNPFNDRSTMIKITEYLALGKAVVAFDLREHRVTAGEAAVYAKHNDEMEFAKQIALLMDDPERRRRMGEIGQARVRDNLAWPHQAERLREAYSLLSARVLEKRR